MPAPERYLSGNGSRLTSIEHRRGRPAGGVEHLEAGIAQGDGTGPAELPALDSATTRLSCLSKGTSSPSEAEARPDRLLGTLSGDGARDSQCSGNHRRRCADYADNW